MVKTNSDFLMKKALSARYSPRERAKADLKLYYSYVEEKGDDKGWDKFRKKLRKKYSNPPTSKQKKELGLTKKEMNACSRELKGFVSRKPKSRYPVDLFYSTSWPLVKKLAREGDKILDIGFGDYPTFIEFLNSRGYSAYGIEPFPKKFDSKKSFKGTMKSLPKKLNQKYDIILANLVYTVNYTYHFSKKFKWELKNKKTLIRKLASLLNKKGYLVLVDDIGTIFPRKDLERYFRVIVYEKDNEGRITLLRKNEKNNN